MRYLIDKWLNDPTRADASLISVRLVQHNNFVEVVNTAGLSYSVDPYGVFSWIDKGGQPGQYELAELTDKGLVFNPKWNDKDPFFFVTLI